jgi:hypothetical protein
MEWKVRLGVGIGRDLIEMEIKLGRDVVGMIDGV